MCATACPISYNAVMDPLREFGRTLLVIGGLISIVGALLYFSGKLPFRLGRLPGDIIFQRGGATVYLQRREPPVTP